jgi:8-oxo-dGTP pyrophosphatase MutT (NUDIX family)
VLYEDTVAVLTAWVAPTARAEEARRRTLELLEAGPVALTRGHRPGHVTASTLVVDSGGRILLCLHGRMGLWMQLGGHCEPGDTTVAGAALREATEESGLDGLTLLPGPIDVDIHPVRCKPDDGGPATDSFHYDVRFVAVCPAGAVEQVSDESAALGWFTRDSLPSPLADGVQQQIAPALARL